MTQEKWCWWGVRTRKREWGKQARRKIPAMTVERVTETQEALQAMGTLPFSASLTSWLSSSNISSWQLVRDTSKIFDYKQRWVISLVLGFVKSVCCVTKPKCWVCLDSTPAASALLRELLWLQMLSRYSCDIYYHKLVTESFVNCHVLNLGIILIFFIYFYKLALALREFLQLTDKALHFLLWKWDLAMHREINLWLRRYILPYLRKSTQIWPNYICPCSPVCLSYSGVNSLKIPFVTAFFPIVYKINKYSITWNLLSCCIILFIWQLILENKVMVITGKKPLCQ